MPRMNNRIGGKQLVLCFQIHQPRRLKHLKQLRATESVFNDELDSEVMQRVAQNCYIPTNALLLRLIEQYPEIKVSFSISGVALEQMESYAPEALDSFKRLAETGSVDFLAETYYHSLAFLMETDEFEIQILEHAEKLVEHFGIHTGVFRNTNLFYNDDIGRRIAMMGFHGIMTEGSDKALRHNRPHNLYEHRDHNGLNILFRNPRLSDDIAFRVPNPEWNITADQYVQWLDTMPENENIVVVSLDYETFGEHHKAESGVFNFLEHLLLLLAIQKTYRMCTASEIVHGYHAERMISIPDYVAVSGCDLSNWVGNEMQREAFSAMIALENVVKRYNDPELIRTWRALQSSDHFYYMSEKAYYHHCLSPFSSAQDAYEQYMQAIHHITSKIDDPLSEHDPEKINEAMEAERRSVNAPLWALNIEARS
jgi:alpha-amylase